MSGSLSSSNTHMTPEFLSTCVRINKNRKIYMYDPSRDEIFKAYRSKFGKVKNEDEVCYASGSGSDVDADNSDDEDDVDFPAV